MQGDFKALQPLRLSLQEPYNLQDDNPGGVFHDWEILPSALWFPEELV